MGAPPQEEILIRYLADTMNVVNDVLRKSSGGGAGPSKAPGRLLAAAGRAHSDVGQGLAAPTRPGQLAQQQPLFSGKQVAAASPRAILNASGTGRGAHPAVPSSTGRALSVAATAGMLGGTMLPGAGPINTMMTHAMRKGPPPPPSSLRQPPHHHLTKAAPPKLQAIPERGRAPPATTSQQPQPQAQQPPSKPVLNPHNASSLPPTMPASASSGPRSSIQPPTEAALRQLPLVDRPGTYKHVPSEVASHAGWWRRPNSGSSNVSYPRTAVTESGSVTPSELAAWEARMTDLEKTIREERLRRARFEEELKTLQEMASSRGGLSTGAIATAGAAKPHAGYEQAAARGR